MSFGPSFRYHLKKDDSTWYKVDTDGYTVLTTTTPTPLFFAPASWDQVQGRWARSQTYMGLTTSVSSEFEMKGDGAAILRWLYFTGGIEAHCILVIEELNTDLGIYDVWSTGDMDFSQIKASLKTSRITAVEGGLNSMLNAYESQNVEVPIEDSDCLPVLMDGIKLQGATSYKLVAASRNGFAGDLMFSPEMNLIAHEGDYNTVTTGSPVWLAMGFPASNSFNYPAGTFTTPHDNQLYEALQTLNVVIRFTTSLWYSFPTSVSVPAVRARVAVVVVTNDESNPNSVFSQNITIFEDVDLLYGQSRTLNLNLTSPTITINRTDRVYVTIYFHKTASGTANIDFNYTDGTVTSSEDFFVSATLTKGYRLHQLWEKLVDKITNGAYPGYSQYLSTSQVVSANYDNNPYDTIVTCGNALRQLSGPSIVTSIVDFFKCIRSTQCMGLGVENDKLVVERLEHFFQYTEICDLGEVTELEFEPMGEEFFGNTLKIGYDKQDYDKLNGRDEFNTTSEFQLPLTRIPKEINLVSPYRADMYGIEYTRANLIGKNTTDNKSDNDVFIISINPLMGPGFYTLWRPNTAVNTIGLIDPASAFNIDLSPASNLLRNKVYLATLCDKVLGTKQVKFQTSDKNQGLARSIYSGNIIEAASYDVSSLGTGLFQPVLIKFKPIIPRNLYTLMKTKKYGYFTFSYQGVKGRGYVWDVGQQPATNDTYQFQLLPTIDTDLKLFHNAL